MHHLLLKVYDHHDLERPGGGKDLDHCVVTKMGSCATIVAEKILQEKPDIKDASFFHLVRSTIVLDTENFDPDRQKTTPRDVAVMELIEKSLGSVEETREELLRRLMAAKADMSGFTVDMMLKKDMKAVKAGHGGKVSISTLPQTTSFPLLERDGVEADLEAVRAELELECVVVLGNGDMIVYPTGEKCASVIREAFGGSAEVVYKDTVGRFDRYERGKSSNRKKILPIVKKAINP